MSTISENSNEQTLTPVMVSIVVPFYNSARFLRETLESVQKQVYPLWECLLVDDGSSDESAKIVREFQENDNRFRYIKRKKEPRGVSSSRNEGVTQSKGKYLLFLDSDDILSSSCLLSRVHYLEQHQSLDFAVFQVETFGLYRSKMTTSRKDYLEAFIGFDFPWTVSSPLWKKDFFKTLSGFNTYLTLFEDPELHIRALLISSEFDVLIDSEPDLFYRQWKRSPIIKSVIYRRDLNALIQYLGVLPKLIISSHLDMKILRNGYFLLLTKILLPIEQWECDLLDNTLYHNRKDGIFGTFRFGVLKSMVSLLKTTKSRSFHRVILMLMQLITSPFNFTSSYGDALRRKIKSKKE